MKNLKKNAQSLIEYGLILALVAVIAMTVLSKFGTTITGVGDKANSTINDAADASMCTAKGKTWTPATEGKAATATTPEVKAVPGSCN